MNFLDKFELVPVVLGTLNSLGMPRFHRCMRCGVNHKIAWENYRYLDGVVSVGKTFCRCGDEVVSIWGDSMALASQFAERYARENPVKKRKASA